MEKFLILNLGKVLEKKARRKRASYVIGLIKEKAARISSAKSVKISKKLNEEIWKRSAQKPPRKLRIKLIKDDDEVRVELVG